MRISYTYDPCPHYVRAINGARGLPELADALEPYRLIAADAIEATHHADFVWDEFQAGLRKERTGTFAGEAWCKKYIAITMPAVMMHVSIVAQQYQAPWGLAYIRLKEAGLITEQNGIARIRQERAP